MPKHPGHMVLLLLLLFWGPLAAAWVPAANTPEMPAAETMAACCEPAGDSCGAGPDCPASSCLSHCGLLPGGALTVLPAAIGPLRGAPRSHYRSLRPPPSAPPPRVV